MAAARNRDSAQREPTKRSDVECRRLAWRPPEIDLRVDESLNANQRGAPTTDCLLSAKKALPTQDQNCFSLDRTMSRLYTGCPYRLSFSPRYALGRAPQGVPLPIVFSRRYALGRAPTRGAPTDCLLSAFGPAKGTHKGCPYRLSSLGVWPCEGRPQGAPLPIVFSRRLALRRAPTRGAPTRFRQPHEVFSNLMQLP